MARHGPTGRSTGRAAEPATGLRPRTNMHVHGATNLLPPVEESVEDRGGGGGGGTMDRHGKHRDNVYCAFESWLRSRAGLRGGGDYTVRAGIMERFSDGWNSAGCFQDWKRLEIEWVNRNRGRNTVSSNLSFLAGGELFFSRGKILSRFSYCFQGRRNLERSIKIDS